MQTRKYLLVIGTAFLAATCSSLAIAAQESANPAGFNASEVKESQSGPAAPVKMLLVEAAILRDGQVIATPKMKIHEGQKFAFQVGSKGQETYLVEGTSTVGADGKITTDFVYEITQWQGENKHLRRMQQAVKAEAGETFTVGGIRDDAGKQAGLMLTVRPVAQD